VRRADAAGGFGDIFLTRTPACLGGPRLACPYVNVKTWTPGTEASEATPFSERPWPGMTKRLSLPDLIGKCMPPRRVAVVAPGLAHACLAIGCQIYNLQSPGYRERLRKNYLGRAFAHKMLLDREIVALRNDPQYKTATQARLKFVSADLVRQGVSDLRPEISSTIKLIHALTKARVMRRELYICSTSLVERVLNSEMVWPRKPASVKELCEEERENYLWMRYDVPRVDALLSRCKALMEDAAFRDVVKRFSSVAQSRKNSELTSIRAQLEILHQETIRSIRSRGVFDEIVNMQRDEFYKANEREIQQEFLNAEKTGNLGFLPASRGDKINE
jgi:hypothetical protein